MTAKYGKNWEKCGDKKDGMQYEEDMNVILNLFCLIYLAVEEREWSEYI